MCLHSNQSTWHRLGSSIATGLDLDQTVAHTATKHTCSSLLRYRFSSKSESLVPGGSCSKGTSCCQHPACCSVHVLHHPSASACTHQLCICLLHQQYQKNPCCCDLLRPCCSEHAAESCSRLEGPHAPEAEGGCCCCNLQGGAAWCDVPPDSSNGFDKNDVQLYLSRDG